MRRAVLTAAFALAAALPHAHAHAPRAAAVGPRAHAAQKSAEGFRRARQARPDAAPEAAAFEFESEGFRYHVAANGHGRRTKGERTRRFNLQLDGRDYIVGLRFALYDGDLLLVCELDDGETGGGRVTRVEQPSMRALWRQEVPAPDLGEPLRDGHSLYVTGAGFVARLDLRTGEYVWLHEGLHDANAEAADEAFRSFETPELKGDAVLFRGRAVYNRRRTLVVNRKTGDVIRIE